MIFKKSQKQPAAATPADSAQSLAAWAKQLHNKAVAAKGEGRLDEALELLDELIGRVRTAAHARSPQLLHIIAKASGLRAITLDQAGGRQREVIVAVDGALEALSALEALGAGSPDVERQIPPMLVLRISAAEACSVGELELTRLLEDSIERVRRLPVDSRRAMVWLSWNKRLISAHLDHGRTAEAIAVTRQTIDRLPAIGTSPELAFIAVYSGIHLAFETCPKLADAGERDLAAELARGCVALLGDPPTTEFGESQSLKIAKSYYLTGMKFLGVTGTSLKLLAAAVAQFRVAHAFESRDTKVRFLAVGSLNAYAWELACRNGIGDNDAALPMAKEAVEHARALADEASSHPDMPAHVTLAESLDTLATIHAQLGDTAVALETAREAQAVARQAADTERVTSARPLERTSKLVELIEHGALAGFTDRE